MQRIQDSLNPAFINVVEFRHSSWWNEEAYRRLKQHYIIFCSISHPQLPDEIAGNGDTVYYRFHGVPDIYSSLYNDAEMARIAHSIER